MKYYVEESLRNFPFWSGAKDRVKYLTDEQLDQIESILEDCEPAEGWSDTAINDFFWFEEDTIAEWLGYSSFEALMNGEEEDDDDDDDDDLEPEIGEVFEYDGMRLICEKGECGEECAFIRYSECPKNLLCSACDRTDGEQVIFRKIK